MPKITVIVPVYNVEKYLNRCIESIISQSFKDFELILVDDGSTDNCPAMCDEWAKKDSRIKVIHKKNEGVSIARNTALDIAQGEYIAFCDSDDSWCENLLATAFQIATTNKADNVLFNFNVISNNLNASSAFDSGTYDILEEKDKIDYIINFILPHKHGWEMWSRLYKNEIIQKFNIRCCTTCNNFAEDMGFVIKYILHSNRICCTKDSLYNYMIHDESMMSRSKNLIRLNDMNEVSFDIGNEFFKTINDHRERQKYPIIHFLVINNQIPKLVKTNELRRLSEYIRHLDNRRWWDDNIRNLRKCYKPLKKYFGKDNAQRAILFSFYLKHVNWKRYCYQNALYYKFLKRFICR